MAMAGLPAGDEVAQEKRQGEITYLFIGSYCFTAIGRILMLRKETLP